MTVFAIDKLMQETRRLAVQYRESTGQTLPISTELGRYDAARLLNLIPQNGVKSSDFVGQQDPLTNQVIQIKSRVIFDENKSGYRIGQLDMAANWQITLLVLYDASYEPFAIYAASKEAICEAIAKRSKSSQRGLMSLAQFKLISDLIWVPEALSSRRTG
jgi:hypothetical protein